MADSENTTNLPRRLFLRQLAGLPLIGGKIALVGLPIAVAEPMSETLLENYNQWLWYEHMRCARELTEKFGGDDRRFAPQMNAGSAFHTKRDWNYDPGLAPASSRAAIVLSAVGCDWKTDRSYRNRERFY